MNRVAAVLPAYNAGATVGDVVREVLCLLPQVLVVDDGSADNTRGRAEKAGARVLSHPVNMGKGAALRTAFQTLRPQRLDALITLDADGQHDPRDIPAFLETFRITRADLVIGSRTDAFAKMPPLRRFGNRFSSSALAFFSGLQLSDSQCGFRLYSISAVRTLFLRGTAFETEMEILMESVARNLRVTTVPIHLRFADGSRGSHYRPWLDTYRICRCVLGASLRRRFGF